MKCQSQAAECLVHYRYGLTPRLLIVNSCCQPRLFVHRSVRLKWLNASPSWVPRSLQVWADTEAAHREWLLSTTFVCTSVRLKWLNASSSWVPRSLQVWADTEAAHRERLLSTTRSGAGRKLGKVLSLTAMLSAPSAALLVTSTPLFVFILVRVHVSKLQETETVSAKVGWQLIRR